MEVLLKGVSEADRETDEIEGPVFVKSGWKVGGIYYLFAAFGK